MAPTLEQSLTAQGSILGTFQYMAPEQIEGQEADARTDISAFGVVLYEMLTGRKAFEGKSHASLIGAILKGASVINCCYAARGIGVSLTTTKTVDCPDLTFSDTRRNIAGGKISLNVNGRVVSPACIAGVLISPPNFSAL